MKIIKRITAILLLLIATSAISYFVYTAKQTSPENNAPEAAYESDTKA